jgi:hypothetical protein
MYNHGFHLDSKGRHRNKCAGSGHGSVGSEEGINFGLRLAYRYELAAENFEDEDADIQRRTREKYAHLSAQIYERINK